MAQVQELCEAANKEVGPQEGVRIANFLCSGNYAVSGGLPGCEVSALLHAPLSRKGLGKSNLAFGQTIAR